MQGMALFRVVWLGQLLSLTGSMMSGIAFGYWLWTETGQVSALTTLTLVGMLPAIGLAGPIGRLLDQTPLRSALLWSAVAGAAASGVAALAWTWSGDLPVWVLYALTGWLGVLSAVQQPGLMALVPLLLRREEFSRANGFVALAQSSGTLIAPALAALILKVGGLQGVLWLDAISFLLAAVTLLLLPRKQAGGQGQPALRAAQSGWTPIWQDRTLRVLLLIGVALAAVGSLGNLLLTPLVLARSGNSSVALGLVLTALGTGGVVGGLALTLWRGARNLKGATVLGLLLVAGLGLLPLALNLGLPGWMAGAFMLGLSIPLVTTSTMTLWQERTPDELRGRVFALRMAAARLASVLVVLLTGPLVDRVLQPFLQGLPDWPAVLGTGTGSAAAMALILLAAAAGCVLIALLTAASLQDTTPSRVPDAST